MGAFLGQSIHQRYRLPAMPEAGDTEEKGYGQRPGEGHCKNKADLFLVRWIEYKNVAARSPRHCTTFLS